MECIENSSSQEVPRVTGTLPGALPPDVAAVRSALMEGLATVEAFAAGAGKCKRVIDGWIAQGLPTIYIGRTPYIPIAEARAWLLRPGTRNAPPRKAGRPSKKAA